MEIAAYFSPDDDLEQKVIEQIERAEYSICVQAYKFASKRIKAALLEAKASKGEALVIKVLLDRMEMRRSLRAKSNSLTALQAQVICELSDSKSADVRCITGVDKSHNKVLIVDERVVLTGSFNFKPPLKRVSRKRIEIKHQLDNLILIEHEEIARNYLRMFDTYFAYSCSPL